MLHSGHVAFFEEAASYGDLYVGLGSDRTIQELKGRKTVNPEAERLYMVKALRCVKDAWINSGSGIMDFEKEVRELRPDIFFVNTDGFTPAKEAFCRELGIRLVVSQRRPHAGLPARSTTALRQECLIPYRVELGGGWLDQPMCNSLAPGPVVVVSIEPEVEFNHRSGMATSSRQTAIRLWHTAIPEGDRVELARTLFCCDNPPGSTTISGSQDHLGMLLPGLNRLDYDHDFWPVNITSCLEPAILDFVEQHLYLVQLPPRTDDFSVLSETHISREGVHRLAEAASRLWEAILARDVAAWGAAATESFQAQLAMFPRMMTPQVQDFIGQHGKTLAGWKLSGAGGGGCLVCISDHPVHNAFRIHICRC